MCRKLTIDGTAGFWQSEGVYLQWVNRYNYGKQLFALGPLYKYITTARSDEFQWFTLQRYLFLLFCIYSLLSDSVISLI